MFLFILLSSFSLYINTYYLQTQHDLQSEGQMEGGVDENRPKRRQTGVVWALYDAHVRNDNGTEQQKKKKPPHTNLSWRDA